MPPLSLNKKSKITKRKDFLNIKRSGVRKHGRFLLLSVKHQKDLVNPRLGITVSKKVGKAHVRNLIKRRIRHIFRINQNIFGPKLIVVVAKDDAATCSFAELSRDLLNTFNQVVYRTKKPPTRLFGVMSNEHNI